MSRKLESGRRGWRKGALVAGANGDGCVETKFVALNTQTVAPSA
jgi:hypothetical protein